LKKVNKHAELGLSLIRVKGMLTRYSMLLTEKKLKVLYRLYNDDGELVANIILEFRNNRIYTSLIMLKEVEIEELSRVLKAAKRDFQEVMAAKRRGHEIELSKLLEENIVRV